MKDPIGAFDAIRDYFILYIKTAFSTRFPSMEAEREKLLREPRVMCQEPWIEPLPVYQKSGKTISSLTNEDLPGLNEQDMIRFKSLVSCGLFKDYELHSHQAEMLKKTLDCNNCIITAGTGSGKTESFLLPLFAHISREAANWEAPDTPDLRVNNCGMTRNGRIHVLVKKIGFSKHIEFPSVVMRSVKQPFAHLLFIP